MIRYLFNILNAISYFSVTLLLTALITTLIIFIIKILKIKINEGDEFIIYKSRKTYFYIVLISFLITITFFRVCSTHFENTYFTKITKINKT